MASETALQARIRKALLREYPGAVMWKIHGGPSQAAGIPDLLGCIEGRLVGLEVKLPGGSHPVSSIQEAQLSAIRRAGGIAAVVRGTREALDVVAEGLASG